MLTHTELAELRQRSDTKGLLQLTSHLLALLVSSLMIYNVQDTLWLWPAMLLQGGLLAFLFAPLHETIHRTAFKSRWLNDAVAWLCGIFLMLPPLYFRAFHFEHHRFTQNPERDPELATPKPATLRQYLWHISGAGYWIDRLKTTCRHAHGHFDEAYLKAPRLRARIQREAIVLLSIYALIIAFSILAQSWAAIIYWLLPALLGQPLLRLFLLAEHTGCPMVADMLKNSRTTHSNRIVRWLTWNMPYHAEHHAYAALPFHALPKAHRLLNSHISEQASGYLAVHRRLVRGLL